MEKINKAREDFLESWFVFSMTGNIEDARMFLEALDTYDLLLSEDNLELE